MAYDETLAERIRARVNRRKGMVERKMFGGVGWLLNGKMAVGVWKDQLIVRLDPAAGEGALKQRHVRVFDITGRAMKGWILVQPAGVKTDAALAKWVDVGLRFAAGLPKKGKFGQRGTLAARRGAVDGRASALY
jgi:hypothetical protein